VAGKTLLTDGCVNPNFGLLRSGRRMRIRPDSAIRNDAVAKMKDSSLNVIIDRITRISPTVEVLFLEMGIPTLPWGRGV